VRANCCVHEELLCFYLRPESGSDFVPINIAWAILSRVCEFCHRKGCATFQNLAVFLHFLAAVQADVDMSFRFANFLQRESGRQFAYFGR
jgi:hypothetical protein